MTRPFLSAGRTDVGKVRRRNEDAILIRDDVGLWAVADGLGGHAAGDYASGLVAQRLAAVPRAGDASDFIESIEDALAASNAELQLAARERAVDLIASTVVVLVHTPDFLCCGWVGDSRAYCHADGRLIQLTRDHVYGGDDAGTRPAGSGMLTRAVGAESSVFVDWVLVEARRDSTFLLCSDGLNKEMSDAEIGAACQQHASAAALLDEVFAISLERAARDNISAVIVRLQEGATTPGRLAAANRELSLLDEAQRRGLTSRDDYRARRRRLLADASADARKPQRGGLRSWKHWLPRRR